MKFLNGNYYVEIKDHRYRTHPTEKNFSRLRDERKILRTQYQVQNDTQMRKNQKVIKNGDNELIVKNYPTKNQLFINQNLNHQTVPVANEIFG